MVGFIDYEQYHQEQIAKTVFVIVPCSSYERLCLYREWVEERGHVFEQGNPGKTIYYGYSQRMHATIWFDKFEGQVVAFVEPGGEQVAWRRLDEHLREIFSHVPKWDNGTRAPFSNPMNFHLCMDAIDEINSVGKDRTQSEDP